jgi:uncharacterized membrane protein YsdA (DUF1294 family)/cold shock CspA family protein
VHDGLDLALYAVRGQTFAGNVTKREGTNAMRTARAPRYQGKVASWNDDKGFGFIAPNGGGAAIFVHIKAFGDRRTRPASGDVVSFDLASNERGQPRADNVAFVNGGRPARSSAPAGAMSVIIALGFLAAIAVAVFAAVLPRAILGLYIVASVLALMAYAIDKSAARNNRWRTKESTLHLFALVGGWPGALLAQRIFKHKSQKQSFREVFWLTVVLNCAGLGWLVSPYGNDIMLQIASM